LFKKGGKAEQKKTRQQTMIGGGSGEEKRKVRVGEKAALATKQQLKLKGRQIKSDEQERIHT